MQNMLYTQEVGESWRGMTVDDILKTEWALPKKMVHRWRMERSVFVNHEPANWHLSLSAGDIVSFPFFTPASFGAEPHPSAPAVLYEDEHLLVANKQAGVKTHPNDESDKNTLLNSVCWHVARSGVTLPVRHVHRLDEGTTGAVLFAKHDAAYAILSRLLEQKKIYRTYQAITDGMIRQKNGTINKPIGKDRHHPSRRRISPGGQSAVTHFRVIRHLDRKTLVECRLETGRTHQIRVHLASLGHPITGDALYGGSSGPHTLLHAAELVIPHPFGQKTITVTAPFPESFARFVK